MSCYRGGVALPENDPDWSNLSQAYGPAGDIPELLDRMVCDAGDPVWHDLFSCLCHQGTVYSASFPALPVMLAFARTCPSSERTAPLDLAGAIWSSDDVKGNRDELASGLAQVIGDLESLSDEALASDAVPRLDRIYLLQAACAFKGADAWGRLLDHMADGEFPAKCPECDAEFAAVVGKYGTFVSGFDWLEQAQANRQPIEPADATRLDVIGTWMAHMAGATGDTELAFWIRCLFGSALCPECGAEIALETAIRRYCEN